MSIVAEPAEVTFDPRGPLFAPRVREVPHEGLTVLIDPDRVGWISVNELGGRWIAAANGRTGEELLDALGADSPRRVQAGERFLRQAARRGFLARVGLPGGGNHTIGGSRCCASAPSLQPCS